MISPIAPMRAGAEEFWPLEDPDPETPIYEQICARRMSRPGNWPDMHAPTDYELDYRISHQLDRIVLRHLWTSPSRPVCGAVWQNECVPVAAHQHRYRHVCLLPPGHGEKVHFAPGELGGFVWPRRRTDG